MGNKKNKTLLQMKLIALVALFAGVEAVKVHNHDFVKLAHKAKHTRQAKQLIKIESESQSAQTFPLMRRQRSLKPSTVCQMTLRSLDKTTLTTWRLKASSSPRMRWPRLRRCSTSLTLMAMALTPRTSSSTPWTCTKSTANEQQQPP